MSVKMRMSPLLYEMKIIVSFFLNKICHSPEVIGPAPCHLPYVPMGDVLMGGGDNDTLE
jgi:hypothetical protein